MVGRLRQIICLRLKLISGIAQRIHKLEVLARRERGIVALRGVAFLVLSDEVIRIFAVAESNIVE